MAATRLVPGCFSAAAPLECTTMLGLLQGVHAGLQHSGHDDAVLRGCVALRLAVVLAQQGQLENALTVARQVCHSRD